MLIELWRQPSSLARRRMSVRFNFSCTFSNTMFAYETFLNSLIELHIVQCCVSGTCPRRGSSLFSFLFERGNVSNGRAEPSGRQWVNVFLCSSYNSESLIHVMSNILDYLKNLVIELIHLFIKNLPLGCQILILCKFVILLNLLPCKIRAEIEYLKL